MDQIYLAGRLGQVLLDNLECQLGLVGLLFLVSQESLALRCIPEVQQDLLVLQARGTHLFLELHCIQDLL